jgi:hypothetical protein
MSRPPFKRLTIIGKRHRVVWDAVLDGIDGEMDFERNQISIAPGLPHDEERDTVLHEVTHAVEKQLNCSIPEDKLRIIVTGLYAVLKDNPKLAAYLLEDEADDDRADQGVG